MAVAAQRARDFGFHTLACASTGNLSAAVAAAAAALGLRGVVFVPADLEPAKIAQAAALGATVVRVDGPYDAVNRLCLELTDELDGWAVVNVNLRPFYVEGSKTIAFEIAEQLGWRAPDAVVAPIASGSLYTKIARGFEELVDGRADRGACHPLHRRPGCRLRTGGVGLRGRRDRDHAGGPRPTRSCARWPSAALPMGCRPWSWRGGAGAASRGSATRRSSPRSATWPRPRAS